MNIYEEANAITTQEDFVKFLVQFKITYNTTRGDWDNDNLEQFLEGLCGYVTDMGDSDATWATFAKLLLAARVYE